MAQETEASAKSASKTENAIGVDRTEGKMRSEATLKAHAKNKGEVLDELTGWGADQEQKLDGGSHGEVVAKVATFAIDAGAKGLIVSEISSSIGQLQSAANQSVRGIDANIQAVVKAEPRIKADVNTNTCVRVKPVNVKTNLKVRTAIGI